MSKKDVLDAVMKLTPDYSALLDAVKRVIALFPQTAPLRTMLVESEDPTKHRFLGAADIGSVMMMEIGSALAGHDAPATFDRTAYRNLVVALFESMTDIMDEDIAKYEAKRANQ